MNAEEMPVMKKIRELDEALSSSTVVVGWIDGNGTAQTAHANLMAKKSTGEDQPGIGKPASIALIARTLNYGRQKGITAEGKKYPAIPARPFMTFAQEIFNKVFPKVMSKYIPMYLSGAIGIEGIFTVIGERAKNSVQEAIRKGDYIPLSPSTIKAKKSSTPLIDTGKMVESVTFEVRRG